jgi:hypothetical protein
MAFVMRTRDYLEELTGTLKQLIASGWPKEANLSSERLPRWWTSDRPELVRANIERAYGELGGEG